MFDKRFFLRHNLNDRCLSLMAEYGPGEAIAAIDLLDDGRDPNEIRNTSRLISALLKKFPKRNELREGSGWSRRNNRHNNVSHGDPLSPPVRAKLNSLYQSGFCRPADIEERALQCLGDISDANGIEALTRLSKNDPREIKQMTGLLIAIMKRYPRHRDFDHKRHEQGGGLQLGGTAPGTTC